ncbi:MAG: DUF2058 domain-containing protein [Candidatus Thiodiazotropha sp. (ex Lucinoma aequizonata)]|nr:DUF2058 domain-containing protein [Candidatus Thiodiazotropha sp. (ex Lucinoma aequizonata)]MCU7888615.1 DUF2058 domain-containing protein [Candidatus Thiodiazotropha sp. (ex Lucinoma aequizonata)]MCU7895569.1 DUF2058 domain-containing protein [Candidatus Thiodiazotropha sp. (ex Lucinoma aequizonata)]MCU7898239.1 DUF2058 domain-containing protein [Candidatus Thiodiazotropha sp. (ex Lucinoma aequizonata)]MCU7903016.1 DUF2058 domain-containing protein [Candidatus Thiodiazotropha sp. (ex Lucino
MANSLQDQLLKAGLTDKNKVNKAKKAKQRKEKEQRYKKNKVDDESVRLAKMAKTKDMERDRELNRRKNEEVEKKAVAAQIRQLVEMNRVPLEDGGITYHFNDDGKVQRIHVTEKLHGQLSRGQLAIVKLDMHYDVIPAGVAEKISWRDAACIIVHNDRELEDDSDDSYADFKVPDDLIW